MASKLPSTVVGSPIQSMPTFNDGNSTPGGTSTPVGTATHAGEASNRTPDTRVILQTSLDANEDANEELERTNARIQDEEDFQKFQRFHEILRLSNSNRRIDNELAIREAELLHPSSQNNASPKRRRRKTSKKLGRNHPLMIVRQTKLPEEKDMKKEVERSRCIRSRTKENILGVKNGVGQEEQGRVTQKKKKRENPVVASC